MFLRFKARVGFRVKMEVMEGRREQGTHKITAETHGEKYAKCGAESEDSTENISQNVWEMYAMRN